MKKTDGPKVFAPLFYKAANDAMYALNVLIAATGSKTIMKLCSELDLEMKSIVKSIQDDVNNSAKNKIVN